jgi:hypothetical protein
VTHAKLRFEMILMNALELAEPWAKEYVEAAFRGDAEAALGLVCALGNENRGSFAVGMWAAKVDRAAFRPFLNLAWEHDHLHVINAAGTKRKLAAMFRYAEFEIPASLGDTVRVWRGTQGVTMAVARTGYSWTTDRDTACFFAMRHAGNIRKPLVITADVSRAAVVCYSDERGESEVLLFKAPPTEIDGDVEDWTARHRVVCEQINKSNADWMAQSAAKRALV